MNNCRKYKSWFKKEMVKELDKLNKSIKDISFEEFYKLVEDRDKQRRIYRKCKGLKLKVEVKDLKALARFIYDGLRGKEAN